MSNRPVFVPPRILVKLANDERGVSAIMLALCAPILFGFAALATDVASWQVAQKSMQGVADAAAFSAQVAYTTADGTNYTTQAKAIAASLGYTDGQNGVTVTVHQPPASGNYAQPTSTAIEVIVQQPQPRFLSGLFLSADPTVTARAVAAVNPNNGTACMLALDPTANQAINVSGSGAINAPNCYVVSDSSSSSSINMSGSASANVACLVAVGTVQTTSALTENKCTTPKIHSSSVADPYASVPEPTQPTVVRTVPSTSSSTNITLQPGYYNGDMNLNGTVQFQPGLYYINGNFSIQGGANASGAGVTFYIVGGHNVAISGGSTTNFTAPTSGPDAGIVYFGDRRTTHGNNNFSGGSSASITGAVYFATQQISYTGGGNTGTGCTQLIADTITISGGSSFNNTGCAGTGVSNIVVPGASAGKAAVVE